MCEPPGTIRVAVVEDHDELRDTLVRLLDSTPDLECVGSYATGEAALESLPSLDPDVVLMDIELPGLSGVECIAALGERHVRTQIVMLTAFEDSEYIFESVKAGAMGYLLKRAPARDLCQAVRDVHAGAAPMTGSVARKLVEHFARTERARPASETPAELASLTQREREALELLARGYLYKQIAAELSISVNTVRKHLQAVYKKLHVTSRTRAVRKYLEG